MKAVVCRGVGFASNMYQAVVRGYISIAPAPEPEPEPSVPVSEITAAITSLETTIGTLFSSMNKKISYIMKDVADLMKDRYSEDRNLRNLDLRPKRSRDRMKRNIEEDEG